jgi:pyridoxal phosphate enzyme (YggS family)
MKSNIGNILLSLKKELGDSTELVAVSKTKPVEMLQEAYDAGQRIFGENKVQELVSKYEVLPKDIQWHMIGHLQTNKVKYIAPFVSLIHAVDKVKLAKEIDKRAKQNNRVIDCLLQIHIAKESAKFGFSYEECYEFLENELANYPNIHIKGLMAMGTFTSDEKETIEEFMEMQEFFLKMKEKFPQLTELSMGMSGDYHLATQYGSTMVRLGSTIFGKRSYNL